MYMIRKIYCKKYFIVNITEIFGLEKNIYIFYIYQIDMLLQLAYVFTSKHYMQLVSIIFILFVHTLYDIFIKAIF